MAESPSTPVTDPRTPLVVARTLRGATSAWIIADPDAKLSWRASLPGAYGFDQAAHAMRALQAGGARAIDLLPLALPSSWMVNSKATSRAFRRWLTPPSRDVWASLLDVIGPTLSPEEWLALPASVRAQASEATLSLTSIGDGATLASVTKVLALFRPQLVPLMDDAALWFARESVAHPETADAPQSPTSELVPMLDWFARAALAAEGALIEIAVRHQAAVLDAAQVLDRLLWVESWGYRLARDADGEWAQRTRDAMASAVT